MSESDKEMSKLEREMRDKLDWLNTPLGQAAFDAEFAKRCEGLEARIRDTIERLRRAHNISPELWHQPMTI